ncbi:MAG: methyltransferase domain-containing protein [Betaproteobacteria bacterium]
MSSPACNTGCWDYWRADRLQWLPELGIGWYPVSAQPYDAGYWDHYRALDLTPCGSALTAMRIALVARHWAGTVVDIGIGGGRFVEQRGKAGPTFGFDINPHAIQWLIENDAWCDPFRWLPGLPGGLPVEAITCWDSLEHIADPGALIAWVKRFVFVSLPIFVDAADALASKHYKPAEHCWYFTRTGLARFMDGCGFAMIESNAMEQAAGREQIETFVFERVRP